MKLFDCVELLHASIVVPVGSKDLDIRVACGSDMMSEVLAFACATTQMLLTGLVNLQTIRTVELVDIPVVVFVRGKIPNKTMCDLAEAKGISLLSTPLTMFTSCGLLHGAGVRGKENISMDCRYIS